MADIFSNSYVAVAALILGFGFLIFIHELGHFAVAKWVGIRATQFAIGFGNAMVSYRKGIGFRAGGTEKEYATRAIEALRRDGVSLDGLDEHARNRAIMERADALGLGETEYRLNTLPLGGYVKMLGQEDLDPNAQSDDPRAFNRKSVGARAAVISAGVIMNLIFGLLFFILAFRIGVEFPAAVVGGVMPGSPAATTYAEDHEGDPAFQGLQPGDRITHVHGEPIADMTEVRIATALGRGGREVPMTVERDGEAEPLVFRIVPTASAATEGLLSAGIAPADTLTVAESEKRKGEAATTEGTPFRDAGLKPGMVLAAVNGQPVQDDGQFQRVLESLDSSALELTFAPGSSAAAAPVTVNARALPKALYVADASTPSLLGMMPATVLQPMAGTPAARAGIKDNDILAGLGDAEYPAMRDVAALVGDAPGDGLAVKVLRGGETLSLGRVEPSQGRIGVALMPAENTVIAAVSAGSPLARVTADRPLPAGSRLTQVNGVAVATWADFQQVMQDALTTAGGTDAQTADAEEQAVTLDLTFHVNLGGGTSESYEVVLEPAEVSALRGHLAWLPPRGVLFDPMMAKVQADSPWEATVIGVRKTGQFIQQTYITLLRLIQGTIGVKNLRGPVGIVDEGAKISRQGASYFLFFMGLISVNLAVINFLPLPIVDGGLMVFLIIEKLRGSPASPKVQTAVALVGLVGMACIFLVVTYHDLSRIFVG